ncbi:MAG: NifB/NifX family molybdenum-iron cluster-binding protein [Candidatus Hadarchaeota archaeon]
MKIAVPTDSNEVSGHFGRCPEFTIVEVVDGQVKEEKRIENPGHRPGYIPEFLNERGIDWLIAGGIGRKAISLFEDYGVEVTSGLEGVKVEEVIESALNGEIDSGANPCSPGGGKGYGRGREDK